VSLQTGKVLVRIANYTNNFSLVAFRQFSLLAKQKQFFTLRFPPTIVSGKTKIILMLRFAVAI